jgi:hypothetical protein
LVYSPDAQGNRIPDFSHCGYASGDKPIPDVPVRVVVAPQAGDGTKRIQAAIDYVASLTPDTNGLRGTVLLLKGRHSISGQLTIKTSGIALRGQGMNEEGTVILATGLDRRTLIRIFGSPLSREEKRDPFEITDEYVPVGATSFHTSANVSIKSGDTIFITRPSTQTWIDRLGMTEFGGGIGDWRLVWKSRSRDLVWDRIVKSVEGNLVTIDVPITTAIQKEFGGGRVEGYSWPGRISEVGIENLRCESAVDASNPKDESHSWMGITMENVQNAWVRQLAFSHFAGSAVALYESCRGVTVQDCLSLAPISEEAGYRRHTFFTMGQMTLFLRCWAENGRHDFSVGHCAAGPNAFVQCEAEHSSGDSGGIESWASGVLYDNVRIDGGGLSLANRGSSPNGAGWSAANSVLWQCSASTIRCANPPAAQNWAFGCWGEFDGDGVWRKSNEFVKPESLYLAQVSDRLGPETLARVKFMHRATEEATNPEADEAAQLVKASVKPAPRLKEFIESQAASSPISTEAADARRSETLPVDPAPSAPVTRRITITNGWLVCDGKLLIGGIQDVVWWRGNIRPSEASAAEPCLTRFVPGRIGPGFTDDLEQLADQMAAQGKVALDHHYGLWYERRRDDHERVRRPTGDCWPPFYELPFVRSGQGTAWDGLSRYDLTKYNPWYWSRLKEFATLCDARGIVLFHQNYFQHNIIEAGAHWADFPWRSANNINETGFPEPPPYAGDKRIFMADQFYDVSHPVRRKLHQAYIRQCLENFHENSNVIQFTSAEYTGPLPFTQFWIDTVRDWKKETGRKALVALSCTKDVQDAILGDAERAGVVDVIDFRYWWSTSKGTFAPKGGQNLAPRQFERQWKGGRPTDHDLATMAADYHARCPGKAVICDFGQAGWAFVCAGGSIPNLPRETDENLLKAIPHMELWQPDAESPRVLREAGRQYLIYVAGSTAALDLSNEKGTFQVKRVDLKTGAVELRSAVGGGRKIQLPTTDSRPAVFWLVRQS